MTAQVQKLMAEKKEKMVQKLAGWEQVGVGNNPELVKGLQKDPVQITANIKIQTNADVIDHQKTELSQFWKQLQTQNSRNTGAAKLSRENRLMSKKIKELQAKIKAMSKMRPGSAKDVKGGKKKGKKGKAGGSSRTKNPWENENGLGRNFEKSNMVRETERFASDNQPL
jgi:hypothetical protein